MESLLKKEIELFKSLPILVFILRSSNKEVIYCNDESKVDLKNRHNSKLFEDIFLMNDDLNNILDSNWDNNKDTVSIFVRAKDEKKYLLYIKPYEYDKNLSETQLLITCVDITGIKIQDYSRFYNPMHNVYNISTREAGINFLEDCIESVRNENTYFSIAYIYACNIDEAQKDDTSFKKESHIKELGSIIKNSIRATDMFATITDTEFIMIFPKCKHEIMCNILTSIENKLELINHTNERKHGYKIDYAVLEVSAKNISTSDKIIKTVKDMVI